MRSFIRSIFGSHPARFSDDVRWAVGYSQSVAVACGAAKINSAHLLAAAAKHPKGEEILSGQAQDVFAAVCGDRLAFAATPIRTEGRMDSEDEFKQVIQELASGALAAPRRAPARSIEIGDLVRVMRNKKKSSAYAILQRFGLASSGDIAAE